jgi:hypothetical protein
MAMATTTPLRPPWGRRRTRTRWGALHLSLFLLHSLLLLLLAAAHVHQGTDARVDAGVASVEAADGKGTVGVTSPDAGGGPRTLLRDAALANATRLLEAASRVPSGGVKRAQILEELAATYSRARLYREAAEARAESLVHFEALDRERARKRRDKGKGGAKGRETEEAEEDGGGEASPASSPAAPVSSVFARVKSRVSLTQDLKDGRRYPEALAAVRQAQADLTDSAETAARYPALLPLLLRMEASVLECSGDVVGALSRMSRAATVEGGASSSSPAAAAAALPETLQHIRLLRRAIAPDSSLDILPPVLSGLQREYRRKSDALVAQGPWVHPAQLPKTFVPGLASRPWHSVAKHHPHLAPVKRALVDAHADLVADLRALDEAGHLEPETECIHDAAGGGWRFHMLNGHWVDKDSRGCSVHAPRACALIARIEALRIPNFRVLRGGFSVIDTASHLHPHCGITNAQLKFHLGLVVPRQADGGPCARIRVGNTTRAWEEGKVLFFDDSFEHEVWNECESERAVFQLVFTHPGLEVGGPRDPFPAAAAGAGGRTAMVAGGH